MFSSLLKRWWCHNRLPKPQLHGNQRNHLASFNTSRMQKWLKEQSKHRNLKKKTPLTHSGLSFKLGGRCRYVVRAFAHRAMVVGSILDGVNRLSYFLFQPVLHDWCNKGRGMCYPVCEMVHINKPLLLIDKSSIFGGSGFLFSLSEWSLTICLTPYNRK